MDLDPGLRLRLAVGVPADVVAPVDDQHAQPEFAGAALSDGQPEQARPDDGDVDVHEATGQCQVADVCVSSHSSVYSHRGASGSVSRALTCPEPSEECATMGRYTARLHHHGISR